MSLFVNRNLGDRQASYVPSDYAPIPSTELQPWWNSVKMTLNDQLYKIQNRGIFVAPILRGPTIEEGSINIQTNGAANIAQTTFAVDSGSVGIEIGLTRTESGYAYIDFHAFSPVLADFESRIIRAPGANGEFVLQNIGSGDIQITPDTGTIQLGVPWTAITTEVPDGFVQMKDASGTLRKFATVA